MRLDRLRYARRLLFAPLCLALLSFRCSSGYEQPQIPFKALDDYLGVWDGETYRPLYIKGVNLGVGMPGTRPGELALDRELYLRWFQRMSEMGVNVVRVYTLHHPRFYQAVFEYNNYRPDRPLYVIQGVWLDEENPTGGVDLFDYTEDFTVAIEEVVDCVHGNREIAHRLGRAYGKYEIDVSRWVMSWIIGRETYGAEVEYANRMHPEVSSFHGEALSIENSTPAQVWMTERIDHLIRHERENYGSQRPVAFSNWPTLDPLFHKTELHYGDQVIEDQFSLGEDDAVMDLSQADQSRAPAGLFVSYHAYPYYPNFINEDPDYQRVLDREDYNSYFGYLLDLKRHYGRLPVVISEFGIPSSWGVAHWNPNGLNHGGHSETEQARQVQRLTMNVYDSGSAGGVLFSWMDEWWKSTWVVSERVFPKSRFSLWYDATSPEENYGVIAFDQPTTDFDRFSPVTGGGRIRRIRAASDAGFFRFIIDLDPALRDGETLTIGFDTYRDDLGETILPGGIKTEKRSELSLVISAPHQAQLYVTEAYDLFGIWHGVSSDRQKYRSTATDGAPWVPLRWITDGAHASDNFEYVFAQTTYDLGRLKVRRESEPASSNDAVVVGDSVSARIPWLMLQFTDPSTLTVMHDDRSTEVWGEHETAQSEGIALAVVLNGEVVYTPRYKWEPWDTPPEYVEREKPSLKSYQDAIERLPDTPMTR
ncbi:MAG: hypothetical protein JXA30_16230 [Deltaproteobacteria bacterium]|nr:hypothetical protein [Deltaproteobacteria bacterium]